MSNYETTGPVKRASVSATGTDAAVVAAVTGKKIRVTAYNLSLSATGSAIFESDAGSDTALTGALAALANTPLPGGQHNPGGHFETLSGEALIVTIAGGGTLAGCITYQEVAPTA